MSEGQTPKEANAPDAAELRRRDGLSGEAKRALAEADARRAKRDHDAAELPDDETGGPRKIEPTRYGDWERKGIAYDF